MQTTKPADHEAQQSHTSQPQTRAGSEQASLSPSLGNAPAKHLAQRRHWKRSTIVLPLLFAGLLIALVFATSIGSVQISAEAIIKMTLNGTNLFHFPQTWDTTDEIIIFQLRLPHVLGAALV